MDLGHGESVVGLQGQGQLHGVFGILQVDLKAAIAWGVRGACFDHGSPNGYDDARLNNCR